MSTPHAKRAEALDRSEEGGHYNEVLKGGFIGGAAGLAIGLGGVFAASKRYPAFRQLTLPFRAFLVTSSTTFAAIVNADAYGQAFARKGFTNADYQDASSRARDLLNEQRSTKERLMAWGSENRYSIVFASWLASMGVAFAMVNRAPMSTAQKVVQARVYAQGLTLAVLIASAAFEMNDAKKGSGRWDTVREIDPTDPEHKRIIEKKVHKEEYEGQDLWRDMIAAEEKRLAAKKEAEAKRGEAKDEAAKSKQQEA